jgi:hypothetical protein
LNRGFRIESGVPHIGTTLNQDTGPQIRTVPGLTRRTIPDSRRVDGALVFVRNGLRVTYCSPSCTPPLAHPFPPSRSPKSFTRATTRSLRKDAGSSVSSVSLTDSVSQLNRETARSVTVHSKQRQELRAHPARMLNYAEENGNFYAFGVPLSSRLTRRLAAPAPVSLMCMRHQRQACLEELSLLLSVLRM